MRNRKIIQKSVISFCVAFIVLLTSFILDSFSYFLPKLSNGIELNASHKNELEWNADTKGLAPGDYYIVGGRVKGPCDIKINGRMLSSSGNEENELIYRLMLDAPLHVEPSINQNITIKCRETLGFKNGLADAPIILSYKLGNWLEIYRYFLYIGLGILLNFILLLGCYENRSRKGLIAFGVTGLLYSFSLARFPRFFLDNYTATCIHVIIRSLIAISFLKLVSASPKKLNYVTILYSILIAVDFVVSIFFKSHPGMIVLLYKWQYPFYAATTLLIWSDLIKRAQYERTALFFERITCFWAVAQMTDVIPNLLDIGTYKSPLVIIFLTSAIVVLNRRESQNTARIEITVKRILNLLSSNIPATDLFREATLAVFSETTFKRFSIYIDSYCIGKSDRPLQRFERVEEYGYKKDTRMDREIAFSDGNGKVMQEAIAQGRIIFRQGFQDHWYCVIPIGRLGCINLSNDVVADPVAAHESFEIVSRLQSVLGSLADKLLAHTMRKSSFLNKIKTLRGYGEWPVQLGAIFLDLSDFSTCVNRYKMLHRGKDVFGPFVTGTYLPALIKAAGDFVQFEKSEGDLLYLVVLPDFLPANENVSIATTKVITSICSFVSNEGARLCNEAGFEPIDLCVGAYVGHGTIICDEYEVRTVGDTVNFAARLQSCAPRESVMVPEFLAKSFEKENFTISSPREILENKDVLRAVPIYFQKKRSA